MTDRVHDKAGERYWDDLWRDSSSFQPWPINSRKIRYTVERSFFRYISKVLKHYGMINRDKKLIEVGCARSGVLPLFAQELGFKVSGLDYSKNGCELTRWILQRCGADADIYCCDIFVIPNSLIEQFDVVVSFGLVEHFSNTVEIIEALSRLLKPGGVMFTSVPNMAGINGLIQRIMDKNVYNIHVPLTVESLQESHEQVGLHVVECRHFLSNNFGVINVGSNCRSNFEWMIKKVILTFLTRLSMTVWCCERVFGCLTPGRTFSPYINCVAIKPEA